MTFLKPNSHPGCFISREPLRFTAKTFLNRITLVALEEIFLTNCKLLFFDADVAMLKSEVTPGASLTGDPDRFYHQTFYYNRSYIGACFLKEMIFLLQMSKC